MAKRDEQVGYSNGDIRPSDDFPPDGPEAQKRRDRMQKQEKAEGDRRKDRTVPDTRPQQREGLGADVAAGNIPMEDYALPEK
jgi:hypothetical protein